MSVVIPESVSEPRQRHRKKKERKSKMAARLSDGASIDSSTSISMTRSADPYYQDGSQSDRQVSAFLAQYLHVLVNSYKKPKIQSKYGG